MKPNSKLHRPVFQAVVDALSKIFGEGFYADKVIEREFKNNRQWGSRDRKFIAENVYEIVRWWRLVWYCLGEDPSVDSSALWRAVGTWLVLTNHPQHPEALAFSELSSLNKDLIRKRRSFAQSKPAIRESLPDWLFERGLKELGPAWEPTLAHLNTPAPVFLRANRLRTTPEDLLLKLASEEYSAEQVSELSDGLRMKERKNLFSSRAFHDGLFELQDGASQQIAPLLDAQPGARVIDACAGAGGKTLHLAALMKNKGKIIALDIEEKKLIELKRRAARAKVDIAETKLIESSKTIKRLEHSADRVLLDVPCTGLGVVRRNPDTKWKLSEERLAELLAIQTEILQSYSRMAKPGGAMVYATCSILPSENEEQVARFLAQNPEWTLHEERKFQPGAHGFDGFYAARLVRAK